MRVSLFVTCLVDQLWPRVGVATVNVLQRTGCTVEFEEGQTCCGQPAFNTGYLDHARTLAQRWISLVEKSTADAIVLPSGSCTAMVHHFRTLFQEEPEWERRAQQAAKRTYELSSFLVNMLGVEDVGAVFNGRLAWHDACHTLRELGQREEPRRLLARVRGAEIVELDDGESCCGFGGTFSVKYPEVSVSILDHKIDAIRRAKVNAIVSSDTSCLMHIAGRLQRLDIPVRALHLAEVLGETH
jgi:L-lactate dehydrogenase complex protein LldE